MRLSGTLPTNMTNTLNNENNNLEIKRKIEKINDIENKFELDYIENENLDKNFEGFGDAEVNISTIQKSDECLNQINDDRKDENNYIDKYSNFNNRRNLNDIKNDEII